MSLIRPLLRPEVAARLQFHSPDTDTLYKCIPKEVLPIEYGGSSGSILDMKDYWMKKLMERR